MAFIDNQDELDPKNLQGQQQGQQAPQLGQGSSVVGSGGGGGGGGNPSAGVGPGGTGGWTNIQAYLTANQGDTGSADALNKTVGDQFNQERQNFTNDSSKYLTDAQSQADKNKITTDQADQYINQAASAYQYPGAEQTQSGGISDMPTDPNNPSKSSSGGADYQGLVDKFHHSLNDQYSGPKEYNYGFGDQTQQYGADLKDNSSFDSLMSNLYSKKAGQPLSSGQYDLQKQFDVNNQSLVDARNKLSGQYDQLGADRDKTVQDTTKGLGNIEQGYRDTQNKLHDYLSGKSNDYQTQEQQAEADAKSGYQDDRTKDSGHRNALSGDGSGNQWFTDRGLNPGSESWKDLQNEANYVKSNVGVPGGDPGSYFVIDPRVAQTREVWQNQKNAYDANMQALNNFYGDEEAKYRDTGDAQKRAYNSIQDFLGSSADRQKQGFDVGAPYVPPTYSGVRRG